MGELSKEVKAESLSPAKSGTYEDSSHQTGQNGSRLKIGLIAVAGVLAGGLAAAWYYRHTVSILRNPPEASDHSNFGIIEDDNEDHDPQI